MVASDGIDSSVRTNRGRHFNAWPNGIAFDGWCNGGRRGRPRWRRGKTDLAIIVWSHLTGHDVFKLGRAHCATGSNLNEPGANYVLAPGITHIELERVVINIAGAV